MLAIVLVGATACAAGEIEPPAHARVPFDADVFVDCATTGDPAPASVRANSAPEGIEGTFQIEVGDEFTDTCPDYDMFPPAGGKFATYWARCGYYTTPLSVPHAVRSLRNGAVWIAFDPDLDVRSVDVVKATATRSAQILAAPARGLGAPVVLTAWGRQLWLDDVDDPRFDEFINVYAHGPQRPQGDESCFGGYGEPAATFWG